MNIKPLNSDEIRSIISFLQEPYPYYLIKRLEEVLQLTVYCEQIQEIKNRTLSTLIEMYQDKIEDEGK